MPVTAIDVALPWKARQGKRTGHARRRRPLGGVPGACVLTVGSSHAWSVQGKLQLRTIAKSLSLSCFSDSFWSKSKISRG